MIPISYTKEGFYVGGGSIEYYDSESGSSVIFNMKDDGAGMFFGIKTEGDVCFNDKDELVSLIDDFYERFKDIPNNK